VAAGLCAVAAVLTQVVRRPAGVPVANVTPAFTPATVPAAEQA
jgi:hypothetical protein